MNEGTTFNNINDAFLQSLWNVHKYGTTYVIRGKEVKEIIDYSFRILNPTHKVLVCPHRYNNFPATVAETLWVLSGRSDMKFLSYFLPNATNYADPPGREWRGAYGARLKYFFDNYNQIIGVIEALKKDPFTRQAIIVIPRPDYDYNPEIETKDRPCTVFAQFLIRDKKLHCFVRMRSNDVIFGTFNINVFEFTVLQEIIAGIMGCEVGIYHHSAVSFHLYKEHYQRAENIIYDEKTRYNAYDFKQNHPKYQLKFKSYDKFDIIIRDIIDWIEYAIDSKTEPFSGIRFITEFSTNYSNEQMATLSYLAPCMSYVMLKKHGPIAAIKTLTSFALHLNNDVIIATLEYIMTNIHKYCDDANIIAQSRKEVTDFITNQNYDSRSVDFVFWRGTPKTSNV